VNNLIPPPKVLGVFLTVLEVEGLKEEFEGVHG